MSIFNQEDKHLAAAIKTAKIEMMERFLTGAFLTWDPEVIKTMVNASTTEMAVSMLVELAGGGFNGDFINGKIVEKEHLKKAGSTNISNLYKQTKAKGKDALLKHIGKIITKMAEKLVEDLDNWDDK
jgi:hypothetical protein